MMGVNRTMARIGPLAAGAFVLLGAVGCGAAADPVEATFTVKAAPSSVVERAPQPTANLGPEVSPDEQCPGSTVDVAAFIGD
ncbi:hypothetical protein CQY22_008730 [Mycolicibacterium brumae]|uniref:Uncharacterized protein n=1 Tax=Mycolicibacterium brumae TaxID=85968 RepID=A0A2G5PBS1_9MYCO|nr:hypothetical protein CQY22_008730 [Mycolicibacterium brumae]